MSSTFCEIKSRICITDSDMILFEPFMPQTLAQYVAKIMLEKNISGYHVERVTKGAISQSFTNRIKNGEVTGPSARKLKALAIGLGVPEHELFAVARGAKSDRSELVHERLAAIDAIYHQLPKRVRSGVDFLIEVVERETHRVQAEAGSKRQQNVDTIFDIAPGEALPPSGSKIPFVKTGTQAKRKSR